MVGRNAVELDASRERIRRGESNFGNFVAGRPLDPAGRYRVVMPDFLAEGGDRHVELKAMEDRVATGRLISDLVMEAFRERGEIAAALDGRITRLPPNAPPP